MGFEFKSECDDVMWLIHQGEVYDFDEEDGHGASHEVHVFTRTLPDRIVKNLKRYAAEVGATYTPGAKFNTWVWTEHGARFHLEQSVCTGRFDFWGYAETLGGVS